MKIVQNKLTFTKVYVVGTSGIVQKSSSVEGYRFSVTDIERRYLEEAIVWQKNVRGFFWSSNWMPMSHFAYFF